MDIELEQQIRNSERYRAYSDVIGILQKHKSLHKDSSRYASEESCNELFFAMDAIGHLIDEINDLRKEIP